MYGYRPVSWSCFRESGPAFPAVFCGAAPPFFSPLAAPANAVPGGNVLASLHQCRALLFGAM